MKNRQQKSKSICLVSTIYTYSMSILVGIAVAILLFILCISISATPVNVDELSTTKQCINYRLSNISHDEHEVTYNPDITDSMFIELSCDTSHNDVEPINLSKDYCENDLELLAAIVHLEGCDESDKCQQAIASVVLNRAVINKKSIEDVIFEPNQFSPASKIPYTTPCTRCCNNAKYILDNGVTIPLYVTYFRADYYFDWGPRYQNYINYDNTYFSYDIQLYNQYN